jgi:hypothetical protein
MTAAQEALQACSRCGCLGYLHREDEVERGCQLAELRTAFALAIAVVDQARNVSPRICGAAGVLDAKVKAFDDGMSRLPEWLKLSGQA